jgi:hypothetical protein
VFSWPLRSEDFDTIDLPKQCFSCKTSKCVHSIFEKSPASLEGRTLRVRQHGSSVKTYLRTRILAQKNVMNSKNGFYYVKCGS